MHQPQLPLELVLYQYDLSTLRTLDGILVHEPIDKTLLYTRDLDQAREASGTVSVLQSALQWNQLSRGTSTVAAVTVFVLGSNFSKFGGEQGLRWLLGKGMACTSSRGCRYLLGASCSGSLSSAC